MFYNRFKNGAAPILTQPLSLWMKIVAGFPGFEFAQIMPRLRRR